MSRETLKHLNTNTLIGNTAHRGTAWHYRADLQGEEANHYAGAIPVEDVSRRLFNWQAASRKVGIEVPASVETMTHLSEDGTPLRWDVVNDRQAICRDDNHHLMGIFASGYTMHQYDRWLLTTVADILDDDLSISSAGLLRDGAVAWVEVSMPESITTPEGVKFRPNLLATTSFDGSIATTFKRTVTAVVCDNTRQAALGERGQQFKVKHSRHSSARLAPAREALAMVHTVADAFAAEVQRLCEMTVSSIQWEMFLDAYAPTQDGSGAPLTGRAATSADNKRVALRRLYKHDLRAAPWTGTAYGVLQAVNTWAHHESTVRGSTRPERNMLRTVTGDWDRHDREAYVTLQRVLA